MYHPISSSDIKWGSQVLDILEHPSVLAAGVAFVIIIALQVSSTQWTLPVNYILLLVWCWMCVVSPTNCRDCNAYDAGLHEHRAVKH